MLGYWAWINFSMYELGWEGWGRILRMSVVVDWVGVWIHVFAESR